MLVLRVDLYRYLDLSANVTCKYFPDRELVMIVEPNAVHHCCRTTAAHCRRQPIMTPHYITHYNSDMMSA
jgi:hypothetical protein